MQNEKCKMQNGNGKTAVILLLSSLLPPTWVYFGSKQFYLEHCGRPLPWGDAAAAAGAYVFLAAFVLFGVVPALAVKFVFRQRLADYGVGLGDRFRTARSLLVLAPAIVLMAWASSRLPAIRAYFPINRSAAASPGMFAFNAATLVLCCLAWEFYFRGFMQYGLRASLGDTPAILVQTMASTLAHLGRPWPEVYACVAAGLVWGFLAFRTRSLLSGVLQHALLAVALDWFICYG